LKAPVPRSYTLGWLVVLGTLGASAVLSLARVDTRATPPPAGRDLGDGGPFLGDFRLRDQAGATVDDRSLSDRPWIAAFIFTRCPSSCPRITAVMKGLQGRLAGTPVRLVSLTVDPDHDTPEVLDRYARGMGAEPGRWSFLTGPKDEIHRLILERFRVPVAESTPDDVRAGAEAVAHSSRLVLVAPGNRVVGYFDSNDPEAVDELLARARDLGRQPADWVRGLPTVNATLNGLATILLLGGWAMIRSRLVKGHVACMAAALAVSVLFLACYLVYHAMIGGGVPFRGVGPIRVVYFTILLSHVVLAAAIVPLIALTVARALRRRFAAHAAIARVTLPIWLYVSITGVVVYLMLYRMDSPVSLGSGGGP
jgi:protein SCO1/2/putative membrane protein